MKIIKKIAKIIFWTLLVLIALYSIIIIFERVIWKEKTPSIFGYKNFIVLTGSMEPTINIGDIVFVKETDNIKENDIVSFRINNSIITHRVVKKKRKNNVTYYETKGDNNSVKDTETLKIEDIEGKYCFKIPKVGRIILFFQKPIGIIILFLMLGVSLFVNNIINPQED